MHSDCVSFDDLWAASCGLRVSDEHTALGTRRLNGTRPSRTHTHRKRCESVTTGVGGWGMPTTSMDDYWLTSAGCVSVWSVEARAGDRCPREAVLGVWEIRLMCSLGGKKSYPTPSPSPHFTIAIASDPSERLRR